jgi:hypothetical protein
MTSEQRICLPTLAELIDELTINMVKQVKLPEDMDSYTRRMNALLHDIDMVIKENDVALSAQTIRAIIVLAQTNLHIWNDKAEMQEDESRFFDLMKKAHQLNGFRNQSRNYLLELSGEMKPSTQRSNIETDGLQGPEVVQDSSE